MYLGQKKITSLYKRISKKGRVHEYERTKTIVLLRCDSCDEEFVRNKRDIDPKRLNNNYFHVCENCDAKRFAQKRGVEKRKIWNLTASSNLPISKL